MSNHSVQLSVAKTEDIPAIAKLAHTIWHQHYTSIIGTDQINYMLEMMYSYESLTEQMTQKGHVFYLIHEDERCIGFIAVSKMENATHSYFIHKYYLLQELAGKGTGTAAFIELLKLLKPEELRLTVNRQNFKSINFYFKNGFKIEQVADFDIGNGYVMNDFVMVWRK